MGLCCSSDKVSARNTAVTCKQRFEQPVQPLGSATSGARFFKLVPVDDPPSEGGAAAAKVTGGLGLVGTSPCCEEWLGKEYSQAFDELEFYDAALQLREDDEKGCWRVFNYLPSFHGLLPSVSIAVPQQTLEPPRCREANLVVFRSPLEGLVRPRLLCLGIGPRSTALQYRKGTDLDSVLFARQHGVTVEGLMAPPRSLPSEEPGFDARGWAWGDVAQRRAKRTELQALRLREVLTALVDEREAVSEDRQPPSWPSSSSGGQEAVASPAPAGLELIFLGAAEFSELVLLNIVREIASLLHASMDVPVAQKWVGSSVALITECGSPPPRLGPVAPQRWVAMRLRVRLLGWSRSRITDQQSPTSHEEQVDNQVMWQLYLDSLGCLLWEAARLYVHAFCAQEWQDLCVEVYECHSSSDKSVLLGTAELSLSRGSQAIAVGSEARALPLRSPMGSAAGEVLVSVSFGHCAASSRLRGVWRVRVLAARALPWPETRGSPLSQQGREVYAVARVHEETCLGPRRFAQRTRRDTNRLNPAWNEELHFAVAPEGSPAHLERLRGALGCGTPPTEAAAAGDAAGGDPAEPGATLAKHLFEPDALRPDVSAEDLARMAALRQMAFVMEVRAGWLEAVPPVFPPPL